MSRIINLTPDMIKAATEEFAEQLAKCTFTDGRFQYTKTFEDKDDKAILYFTQMAWTKMTALLKEFGKEVAWHGAAKRVEGEDNAYLVYDIMVYPQTVGSTTVDMDEVAYSKWIIENIEDERFDHIRFQGHSHVNMPTSPSGTDLDHQKTILSQLRPDDFYIFVIYNKSLSRDIRIYDFSKNRMFGTADVTVEIIYDFDLDGFMTESKALVKERVSNGYQGSGGYNGYTGSGGYTGYAGGDSRSVTPGGTNKSPSAVDNVNKNKPATKPTHGNWNVPGATGFEEDDGPYPAQK